MKTVIFKNKGIIDAVSIGTFGINVKASDDAIGYFGTGLKYAIAVLLREKQKITILAGKEKYDFETRNNVIRGKDFEIIYMNGIPLGFTTELGKKWKLWQAFRELYCNALDEVGSVDSCKTDEVQPHEEDETTIIIRGYNFYQCYEDRSSIILESEPFYRSEKCNIHFGSSKYIYYKGVRIYDGFPNSLLTYDIRTKVDITEDRTLKYTHEAENCIQDALSKLDDGEIIAKILLAEEDTLEKELDFSAVDQPSDAFLDIACSLMLNLKVNISIIALLTRHKRIPKPEAFVMNNVQNAMLIKAIKFSNRIGYPVDRYEIIVSSDLKGGLMGLAENGVIFIAEETLGMGTKYLASTLIEEYLHLKTGYADCTRALQNYLFNEIVSLGEQIIGEPI